MTKPCNCIIRWMLDVYQRKWCTMQQCILSLFMTTQTMVSRWLLTPLAGGKCVEFVLLILAIAVIYKLLLMEIKFGYFSLCYADLCMIGFFYHYYEWANCNFYQILDSVILCKDSQIWILEKSFLSISNSKYNMKQQEAQLMLTTGSTRLAVSRGQQTWYHSTCYI